MFGLLPDRPPKILKPAETPKHEEVPGSTGASEKGRFWADRMVIESPGKSADTISIPDEASNDHKLLRTNDKMETGGKKNKMGHRGDIQKSYAYALRKIEPVTLIARNLTDEIKDITRNRWDVSQKAMLLEVNIDNLNDLQNPEILKSKKKRLGNELVPQLVDDRTLFQKPGYDHIFNNIGRYHSFITCAKNTEFLLEGCQSFINTLKNFPDSEKCFAPFEWLKAIATANSQTQTADPCAKFALCSVELSNAAALEEHGLSKKYETVTDPFNWVAVANCVEDQPQVSRRTSASGSIRKGGEMEFISLPFKPGKRKKNKDASIDLGECKKPMLSVEEREEVKLLPSDSPFSNPLVKPESLELKKPELLKKKYSVESEPRTPAPLLSPDILTKGDELHQTRGSLVMEPPVLGMAFSEIKPGSSGMEGQVMPLEALSDQPGSRFSVCFGDWDLGELYTEDPMVQEFYICSQSDKDLTQLTLNENDFLPHETVNAVETAVPESKQERISGEDRKPMFTTKALENLSREHLKKNPELLRKLYRIAIRNCQSRIDKSDSDLDALSKEGSIPEEESKSLKSRKNEYREKKSGFENLFESMK